MPLFFQLGGAAHMVKVAVGAQDVGEGGALLFQQGVIVLRGGGRVDDRGVAPSEISRKVLVYMGASPTT